MSQVTRRRAVTGAAAVTGLSLLAACGDDVAGTASDRTSGAPSGSPSPDESSPTSAEPDPTQDTSSQPPQGFASTADVPQGGGTIFADEGVIVTQPQEGTFRGFKNACTHQGCPLQGITETINCDCHGSRFALDGTVVTGPATSPLAEQAIRVEGDQILLA